MFVEYLLSSVWLFFAMFGVLHLSEVGVLSVVAEQASFFAARSEFVGLRGARAARFYAESFGAGDRIAVTTDEAAVGRIARVSLANREHLPLVANDLPVSDLRGLTAVPPRVSR
jgi:hypothetical protein